MTTTPAFPRPWVAHYPPGIVWDTPLDLTPVHTQVLTACTEHADRPALDFMGKNVNMSKEFVFFEVNRYFGWPGQAPSYKVGQRVWEQIRDEYKAKKGADFDIKEFHKTALNLGALGLDTLKFALLG